MLEIKDSLGDRMKIYERAYGGQALMPNAPACARLDGKAFHTFTRGLARPYDSRLSDLMVKLTKFLVAETSATVGYTQSDEVSLIWNSRNPDTMLPFDGKPFKLVSYLAASATAFFNRHLGAAIPEKATSVPLFDARVWSMPTLDEAALYLLWREQDATRNSVSMAAQSYYNHKQLHQVSSSKKMDLLMDKGINWNDYPSFFKRGVYVTRRESLRGYSAIEIDKLPAKHRARTDPELKVIRRDIVMMDLPPLGTVSNRIGVLFGGESALTYKNTDRMPAEKDTPP